MEQLTEAVQTLSVESDFPLVKQRLFILLGAGASADSGIRTYRGENGIYEGKDKIAQPEDTLCLSYLLENPQTFWQIHTPLFEAVRTHSPGPTYQLLQKLIDQNPGSFIATQNVDGYARSVSCPVYELHGNWSTMHCRKCDDRVEVDTTKISCPCGGLYRPDVVLFGESLPSKVVREVKWRSKNSDYVLVIGTTLTFPYLRELIQRSKQRGAKVIHINPADVGALPPSERWIQAPAAEGIKLLLGST